MAQDDIKKPDWTKIRLAYVHSNKTMAEVAKDFGVTHAAIMKRAHTEKWTAERQKASDSIMAAASSKMEELRADELSKWNASDLKIANALRSQVAAAINGAVLAAAPLSPSAIRALAGAAEAVQRVGRLALGASTDNLGHAGQNGEGPIAVANVPLEDYEASLAKILAMT